MSTDPLDDLARHRFEYETAGLDRDDLADDPMVQWQVWFRQASEAGCVEPNAFVLGTVDPDGWPQTRYVLLRGADEDGFTFFTNYDSEKSRQLIATGRGSMLFSWLQLHRQVRVIGDVERVSEQESDDYFASRPRTSQLGAWASPQSQVLPDRAWLENRFEQITERFADVEQVPRPVFWGGWRLRPVAWEFWQGRPSRLHDRLRYRPDATSTVTSTVTTWQVDRLSP